MIKQQQQPIALCICERKKAKEESERKNNEMDKREMQRKERC